MMQFSYRVHGVQFDGRHGNATSTLGFCLPPTGRVVCRLPGRVIDYVLFDGSGGKSGGCTHTGVYPCALKNQAAGPSMPAAASRSNPMITA